VATGRLGVLGSGDDRRSKAGGGGEDTVIGDERTPRSGDQGTESFEERGRREHDRAGPVLPFALEPVDHHSVTAEPEPVVADQEPTNAVRNHFVEPREPVVETLVRSLRVRMGDVASNSAFEPRGPEDGRIARMGAVAGSSRSRCSGLELPDETCLL